MRTRQLSRRGFLGSMAAGAGALLAPRWLSAQDAAAGRPNIVFILADDLGWSDVGFNGGPFIDTPNLDTLTKTGIVFSEAYTPAANCAPSRASMLTGQYTVRHGIFQCDQRPDYKMRSAPNRRDLVTEKFTFAEGLAAAGYECGYVGKWHLGAAGGDKGPTGQGFVLNVAGSNNGSPKSGYFPPYTYPVVERTPAGLVRSEIHEDKGGPYLTDRLADEAIGFIHREHAAPFFVQMSFHNPHTPLQGLPDLVAKYKERLKGRQKPTADLCAMVERMDYNVGRIVQALDDTGLRDNTMIVFMSDNGGFPGGTTNAPLRGAKKDFYEGGIRVPMLVSWPGHVKPGTKSAQPVHGVDLLPTFLDAAGGRAPAGHALDGMSLVPLLEGRQDLPERALFWHFPGYIKGKPPVGTVRRGDYKLLEFFEDGHLELYNIREDIGESRNLAAQMPEKASELHQVMLQWRRDTNAPMPTPNPDYKPAGGAD